MTHLDGSTGTDRLLQLSLYVQAGMRLLPIFEVLSDGSCACGKSTCTAVGKHPRVDGWQYVATTREETLRLWHDTWPTCNWAWAVDEDQYVVDCDPRNGGPRTEKLMDDWASYGFTIPVTRFAFSGGGGVHIICACDPTDRPNGNDSVMVNGTAIPGVNVKGSGGYVLVAPSNHTSGGEYRWHDTPMTSLAEWPALIEQLKSRTRQRQRTQSSNGQREPYVPDPSSSAWDPRDEQGRIVIERWLTNASQVPAGEQHNYLISGVGWLRRAGRSPEEIRIQARAVAERFINYDETNPWTRRESDWTATDAVDRWESVFDEGLQIVREFNGGTGGDSEGGAGEPAPPAWMGEAPADSIHDAMGDGGETRQTDDANAELLARRHGDKLLWRPDEWYFYNGCVWELDSFLERQRLVTEMAREIQAAAIQVADNEARDAMRGRGRRLESSAGFKATIEMARNRLQLRERHPNGRLVKRELDDRPELLAVDNGVVDLTTGELHDFNPSFLLTKMTPTAYVPDTHSELLDDYLRTFVPEPSHQEVLFRVLGSCLLGENRWRTFIILYGGTTTGKSQLAGMLQKVLGEYALATNHSILRGKQDEGPQQELIEALPARLAIMEEASSAWELHADQVKKVTGGDVIAGRGMYAKSVTRRAPAFNPIIVTNQMPTIKGADEAVKRRLVVLPFKHRPAVEDASKRRAFLQDRATREAVLSELVAGCLRAQQGGTSPVADELPVEFQMERDLAFAQFDEVGSIVDELTYLGVLNNVPNHNITMCATFTGFYEAYRWYLRRHGGGHRQEYLQPRAFNKRLRDLNRFSTVQADGTRVVDWVISHPEINMTAGSKHTGQLPGAV